MSMAKKLHTFTKNMREKLLKESTMYCKPTRCQGLVHFYLNLTTVLRGPYFYGQIGRVKISGLESLSTLLGTTVR